MSSSSIPYNHQSMMMGNNGDGCFSKCLQLDGGASSLPFGTAHINNRSSDTKREMKTTEDFLASELSKLSVRERSRALDDLHCVGEDLKETPELIEQSLADFDRILKEKNAPIYDIAAGQNRAYVEDPNFRLRFLRTKHHDAEKAADQLIGFLNQKEIYFGRDKLARDITLDDLNEEDMNLLAKGVYHIQNGRDQNGRMVVYILNHVLNDNDIRLEPLVSQWIWLRQIMKLAWFQLTPSRKLRLNYFVFFHMLSPLESVQAKGIVVCYYDMSTSEKPCNLPHMNANLKFANFATKVPIRRTAVHLCLKAIPGSLMSNNVILGTIFRSLTQQITTRARVHYGSDMELQYKLRSHGLPMENIPINTNGEIRKDILNVWFHRYVAKEWNERLLASLSPLVGEETLDGGDADALETLSFSNHHATSSPCNNKVGQSSQAAATPSILVEPTDKDVLLGRGRGIQMHPGNVRFREFLKEYQDEYNNTPRYKRVDTSKELTRLLLEDGVRFLQKAENGDDWVESNVAEAEKKVKQLFRTRKKLKGKTNQ